MSENDLGLCRKLILVRDIVSGMDIAEMQESFEGQQCDDDYHPFKNCGPIAIQ